ILTRSNNTMRFNMRPSSSVTRDTYVSALSTHIVLRKTYLLLSLTLLFSALMAGAAMITNAPPLHWLIQIVGMFGLLFLTMSLRDSKWGIVSIFAFTGFTGYTLGPVLNAYLMQFSNGSQLILTALGSTGLI